MSESSEETQTKLVTITPPTEAPTKQVQFAPSTKPPAPIAPVAKKMAPRDAITILIKAADIGRQAGAYTFSDCAKINDAINALTVPRPGPRVI